MSAEFVGFTDFRHVQQPEDSELCFPALMSAVSEAGVADAHAVLKDAGLSEADGSTGLFMGDVRLELEGADVTIEPVDLPPTPDEAIKAMDDEFSAGRAVLLMYKKNPDPESADYHWILLTGYATDGEQGQDGERREPIQVSDPLREEIARLSRGVISNMIIQSNDFENGGQGAYAYSLSTDSGPSHEPPRPLTVIPAYDREPAPRKETYTATQQDKVVWLKPDTEESSAAGPEQADAVPA